MIRRSLLCFFFTVSASAMLIAQSNMDRVISEAMKPSPMEKNLQVLTDQIGGRVPGTPAMEQAVKWAVAGFKEAGADSVNPEPFTIGVGWAEGATSVRVVAPVSFKVRAVSAPWAPAFLPTAPLRVVDVGHGSEKDFTDAGSFAGAIVLVHSNVGKVWEDLFGEYLRAPDIIERARKGKAVAIAWISSLPKNLQYRHINAAPNKIANIPAFQVAREDGERISRLIASGSKVMMSVAIPNRITPAFKAFNVVAELRGKEKPDEYVVVGAHLDSWELGTGALDNGCNAALVIDALRAIRKSGLLPKRSIRFVLYSGEEQGMIGSNAFTVRHAAELPNIVADIVIDSGSGAVTGFSLGGRKDALANVNRLLAPLAPLGVKENTTDAFVGTDNIHLLLEGVPTLVANQLEDNYLPNYHASSDTFDKVDLVGLRRHLAIIAATAFAIADSPERIAPRQSLAETKQLINDTGLEDQLRKFSMWDDWEKIAARRK